MPIRERLIILICFVAVLVTVYLVQFKGLLAMKPPAHAGIADNEKMHTDADSEIVGCSNTIPNPVSRVALANTRFLTGPLAMPMLRQTSIGRGIAAHIANNERQA